MLIQRRRRGPLYRERTLSHRWGRVATGAQVVLSVGLAAGYVILRKRYNTLRSDALVVEEARARHRRVLEINDDVVQGLTVAKMALEKGDIAISTTILGNALASARKAITELAGLDGRKRAVTPGDLRRSEASTGAND